MPKKLERYQIQSVERVLDMITIISETERTLTFTEIIEMTGLPKSSTYRYSSTNDSDCRCVVVNIPKSGQNLALSVNAPSSRLPLNQVGDVARDLLETVNELVEALSIRDGQNRGVQ